MSSWALQGLRFAIVGLTSNAVLFAFYLLLTSVGIDPKLAMSAMFILGTIQTFFFNKRWTFGHRGILQTSFLKYLAVYGLAYLSNLIVLIILVDRLGYPHQIVQGIMILVLAVLIFVLQKFWVFRASHQASSAGEM